MKRSDFFIRLTTGVLFLAIASYIGVYIYNATVNTYVTTVAFAYAVEETFPAQGYVVRSETVLSDVGSAILPVVNEGEKVASGQAVAVEYLNRDALEMAGELRMLRLKIAQLEASGATEAVGYANVIDLSAAVHSGNLSRLDELALKIEANIFVGDSASASELPALKARLESLQSRSVGLRMINSPVSGVFSQAVDGFEHIGPGAVSDQMPSTLTELFSAPAIVHGSCKLVTEFKWYFAAIMDAEDASRLTTGRRVPLQFSGAFLAEVEMLVENIGKREDGFCVVLFSSDRGVHDVTQLRKLQAEVVFGIIPGIRVPKEAIHLDDDGVTFIFLQTGVRAERVDVDILLEAGDSYLVRDGLDSGTPLRTGSTIIVKANNLFHGKVVG